jgi:Fe-Mn family superoxide dismutase
LIGSAKIVILKRFKMDRKKFLQNSLIIGGATVLPANSLLAVNANENGIDMLVDKEGNFSLHTLPYKEDSLEPYMDAETMHLHYTFHHGGAVKAANIDLQKIREALDNNTLEIVDFWTKKLSYHFSSHILHTIFWTNLTNNQTSPAGDLIKRIEKNFGSYEKLKTYLATTSKNIDGNGWGILGYQPYSDSLTVLQCENHEKLTQWGVIPLLVIDVWEHSYYLKYKNKRSDFVDALFNIIDWDNVSRRLDVAVKLTK